MANLPTIFLIGQSNADGKADLTAADTLDLLRWFGVSSLPEPGTTTVNGINFWTVQMPTVSATNTISTYSAPTITAGSSVFVAGDVGKWIHMTSGAAAGEVRQIAAYTSATEVDIDTAFGVAPSLADTFAVARTGTIDLATYTGSFRPLTLAYNSSGYSFTTGYEYPNNLTQPLRSQSDYTPKCGPEIELTWQLANHLGSEVFVIKLAIDAAYLGKYGFPLGWASASWFDGGTQHNDWSPASTFKDPQTGTTTYDLYGILVQKLMPAAKAWFVSNRPTDTMDTVGVFVKEGESDSVTPTYAAAAKQNMVVLRDALRAAIADAGMSSLQADHIPWIMSGHAASLWTYASTVNAGFQEVAADDMFSGYISIDSLTTYPRNSGDAAHLDITGQKNLGKAMFDTWVDVRSQAESATSIASKRPTLAEIRTRALIRAERNNVGNDATTSQINQFINDALREFYNTIGENAYFSRLLTNVSVNIFPTATTLPRPIHRLLRLEDSVRSEDLRWSLVGYDDEGKQIINVYDCPAGQVRAHHMATWNDLVNDADRVPVPQEYSELIVLLTVKRMTETFGNEKMMRYYQTEVDRLYKSTKRDILRADRGRHGALSTDEPDWRHSPRPQSTGW